MSAKRYTYRFYVEICRIFSGLISVEKSAVFKDRGGTANQALHELSSGSQFINQNACAIVHVPALAVKNGVGKILAHGPL